MGHPSPLVGFIKLLLSLVMTVLVFAALLPAIHGIPDIAQLQTAEAVRQRLGPLGIQLLFPPIVSFLLLAVAVAFPSSNPADLHPGLAPEPGWRPQASLKSEPGGADGANSPPVLIRAGRRCIIRSNLIDMDVPEDLSQLLQAMAADFPAIFRGNLVGIYLWGSLTYNAFDETCSDVDCIGVTRRDLDDHEFSKLDKWFKNEKAKNRWVDRIDMRFVIDREFLDKSSQCCGFYHYAGKLIRHGSDGNPIIWMNIAQSGITLWGTDAKLIAPKVSAQCLNAALLLELNYLTEDLTSNAGDRSGKAFIHNAYAVLTACRILYSAYHGGLASKDEAYNWAMETVPPMWRAVIQTARANRLKNAGSTTPRLEEEAIHFVEFVAGEVNRILKRSSLS